MPLRTIARLSGKRWRTPNRPDRMRRRRDWRCTCIQKLMAAELRTGRGREYCAHSSVRKAGGSPQLLLAAASTGTRLCRVFSCGSRRCAGVPTPQAHPRYTCQAMAKSKQPTSPHEQTLDDLLDRVSNAREELLTIERTLERLRSDITKMQKNRGGSGKSRP